RHPRPELPSAEKMNRLAGPQPYSAAGAEGPLRRPSFTVRTPETPNGKGRRCRRPRQPPRRKGPAPFKVTPVPVAARPERFPGTTVEEILAKMDSREGPGSPDRAWLSPFCTDPSSRFGSKTFVAFRKRPSGEADGDPADEAPQMPRPAAGDPRSSFPACPCHLHPGPGRSLSHQTPAQRLPFPWLPTHSRGGIPCHLPSRLSRGCCRVPGPPSPPLAKASCPPGSPEGPDDSTMSPRFHEGPDFNPPSRDVGLRGSSEGVLRPPPTGQGLGELGGSLSALPRAGDLLSEPSLGSESSWSLSQSFEWTFPSRGARLPAFPPRSPIRETPDSGLSEEGESDGEAAAPGPPKDSRAEGPGSQQAEGAPCPGGPVAQREAEGSAEEEEREAEQDAPMCHSPLRVTEPGQQPAEPESPTQPSLTTTAPLDPAPPDPAAPADSAWAGDGPKSLQCPGGPGQAEKPSQEPDPHTDPGWLTELLESPGVHGSPEVRGVGGSVGSNLLGWSRKDLCSEFGIGHPRQDSTFDWSHPGAWSGDYRAAELMGDTKLGCSDWSQSLGTGKSCPRDPDFSASTAEWGQGYGSTEELGSRRASWGSGLGTGHDRQLDKEPRSGQPTWAGRYSDRDTEMKDRELTPDWASKYSSQDAGSKDENLTLGWAGRSSTGDSPDKELSPSRPACDRRYNTRDMESQDREFSPSRPAWTGEIRDMESQDREFSPSRPAWTGEYRETESQDQEFTWDDRSSSRDMESQDQEFSPSRAAWDDRSSCKDMESQDREFSPSRPAWDDRSSSRDMESQDQEFSPSRPAWDDRSSSRDMESQDQEFSPRRPAWDDRSSSRDMESQDQEFSPRRPAWDDRSSTKEMESQDREFSPSRLAEAGECSTRDLETQDEFSPSRPAWDDRSSTRNMETQDSEFTSSRAAGDCRHSTGNTETQNGEFSPSRSIWDDRSSTRDVEAQDRELSPSGAARDGQHSSVTPMEEEQEQVPARLSWPGEGIGQTRLVRVGEQDVPSSHRPEPPALGPTWRSAHQQEHHSSGSRDWAEELGAAECQSQFGVIGTDQDLDSWSVEHQDAEARRQEWASAFSQRLSLTTPQPEGSLEQEFPLLEVSGSGDIPVTLYGLGHSMCLWMGHSDPAAPRDSHGLRAPSTAVGAVGVLAGVGVPGLLCQLLPVPWAQQDTELLDSSVFRCKASLGRKRQHRAPSLRPTTTEGESWIFRDSTEPRPAPAASSDEEAAEEPRSRRMRGSSSGRGVKVPLFPGLSASAIKAKLRGRNRSAEEGTSSGDSKGTPPKDPHVQRSKSCKIPGMSGKPPALPPKPEKSSGSEASPPHWLQALKLKRKKP
uniref:Uncharacterized protein n=1 Tax=Geospiza parvula TaxID=87175 RepID=A0A8C3MZB3_GEOPR